MTNKKIAQQNQKISERESIKARETDEKLTRFSNLLAMAGRSKSFLDLADDPDMLLLMKSAVAYTTVSDKVFGKDNMNAETKMGMCFLLGYVVGQSTQKTTDEQKDDSKIE